MKSRLALLGVAATLAVGLTAPAFGGSNVVSSSAASAKSTADKALSKAIKADKRAKAAQQSADGASTAAAAAKTAADAASTKAGAAQTKADSAAAAAAAAQTAANNALTAANSKFDTVTFQDEDTSASDQSNKVQATTCPAGRFAVGGGYTLGGATVNAAYVNINQPYGETAWIVSAQDNPAVNGNWTLTVSTNCIGS